MGASADSVSSRDRRDAIMHLLLEQDSVTVQDLATRFNVSAMTVHRDLDALEEIGVLRKVRGGATAQPTSLYESSLGFRMGRMQAAKQEIARLAALRVGPGASVALDDSTTTLAMVPLLAEIPQLTIVTHFVSVIEEVARLKESELHLIVVGGSYNYKYHAFGGVIAQQQLLDLSVDHSFVSVSSVDVDRGAFHQEVEHAALKRALVRIARDSSLLVDSSKFRASALHRVVALAEFQAIYVDDSIGSATLRAMRDQGLTVHVAGAADTDGLAPGVHNGHSQR
ncbi:MAG: DeoR/GlpR family DNA-binding transcription regulator [Actinomycetota bacterium]|nr:DeoR/GlpR family DNA-binding transcription regulator [Actinomycetota bacterium]